MYIDLGIVGIDKEEQGFIIKSAVEMTLIELLPDDIGLITIDVEIAADDDINDADGLCDQEDDKHYTIFLNRRIITDDVELFKTVAHECVHIKQYVMKQLEHGEKFAIFFDGMFYDRKVYEYHELPWEIEAKELEEKMYWRYANNQQSAT